MAIHYVRLFVSGCLRGENHSFASQRLHPSGGIGEAASEASIFGLRPAQRKAGQSSRQPRSVAMQFQICQQTIIGQQPVEQFGNLFRVPTWNGVPDFRPRSGKTSFLFVERVLRRCDVDVRDTARFLSDGSVFRW